MRGKHSLESKGLDPSRITPAGAGKTNRKNSILSGRKGSPPQVRGKLCPQAPLSGFAGITPAGAGKTAHRQRGEQDSADHPRRCGENWRDFNNGELEPGSPPQVRGKRRKSGHINRIRRITPAGAGKTLTCPSNASRREDHPRRCGENLLCGL